MKFSKPLGAVGLIASLVAYGLIINNIVSADLNSGSASSLLLIWAVSLITTLVLLASFSLFVNDRWFGLIIDNRNKTSLSRLQFTLWTVLLVPSIVIAMMNNSKVPSPKITVYAVGTGVTKSSSIAIPAGCT